MPNYAYQSLSKAGQVRNGVLTALDRADAIRQLLGRGETATSVDLMDSEGAGRKYAAVVPTRNGQSKSARSASAGAPAASRFSFGSISMSRGKPVLRRAEMANLMRELATALEAGLPLMQSLKTVRRQASGRAMPVILDHLIQRVEAG